MSKQRVPIKQIVKRTGYISPAARPIVSQLIGFTGKQLLAGPGNIVALLW